MNRPYTESVDSFEFDAFGFENFFQGFDTEPEAGHAAGNSGDLDGFEHFARARAQGQRALAVQAHAARTVERAADADHDQFFCLTRQCAFAAEGAVDVDAFELLEIFRVELGDDIVGFVLGAERCFFEGFFRPCAILPPKSALRGRAESTKSRRTNYLTRSSSCPSSVSLRLILSRVLRDHDIDERRSVLFQGALERRLDGVGLFDALAEDAEGVGKPGEI